MTRAVQPIVRTMSGQIISLIRERILSGAYPPGSPLLQDGIAAEFGVSKIPVREALVQLKAEGLIDIFAHRGFQVRPLSMAEAQEVFRLRLRIEPSAAAEGALLAQDADRAEARAALVALNEALAGASPERSGELNRRFHFALITPRAQPITAEIVSRLLTLSQRYVRLHLLPAGRIRRAETEHTATWEAWARGDAAEVERLVTAHLEETREDLQGLLAEAS